MVAPGCPAADERTRHRQDHRHLAGRRVIGEQKKRRVLTTSKRKSSLRKRIATVAGTEKPLSMFFRENMAVKARHPLLAFLGKKQVINSTPYMWINGSPVKSRIGIGKIRRAFVT